MMVNVMLQAEIILTGQKPSALSAGATKVALMVGR